MQAAECRPFKAPGRHCADIPSETGSERPELAVARIDRQIANFAIWVLIAWTLLVVTHVFQFAVWGNCLFDFDKNPSCERLKERWRLANGALMGGAVAGGLVAIFGCWIWPRRWRSVWLAAGYLSAIVGILIATA
jgi:hypothetical protein